MAERFAIGCAVTWIAVLFPTWVGAETITVSAAISLKESLTQIAKSYQAVSQDAVHFNFDASGKLSAQIMQGAPVDLFISADLEQMKKLIDSGKVKKEKSQVLLNNALVLIVPPDAKDGPNQFSALASKSDRKIAIGEPKTVPAGHYAMQTLKYLKLDQTLMPRLVLGESVRQVLTYVEQNQVGAGIVYATDAKIAGDKVKVVATADARSHDVIQYPGAVISAATHANAAQHFLDFLTTPAATSIFRSDGFVIPASTTRPAR